MKTLFLRLAIFFSLLCAPALVLSGSVSAYANPLCTTYSGDTCTEGICASAPTSPICAEAAAQHKAAAKDPVVVLLAKAGRIISLAIGLAAVIMVIISGFTMIVSGGNTEEVTKAKNRLVNAVIGVAIAGLAWVITTFAINHIT